MRRAVTQAMALLLLIFSAAAGQADNMCRPAETLTHFGDWRDMAIPVAPAAQITIAPLTDDGQQAASMRLLLGARNLGAKPWSLAIRDQDGHLVAQVERSDFASADAVVWTGRLAGPKVSVSLRGADADTRLEVRGASVGRPTDSGLWAFSISGTTPNWNSLYPTAKDRATHSPPTLKQREAGEAVGIMVDNTLAPVDVGARGSRQSWCCSGVMIGRDLFLTNWHCAGPGGVWNGEVIGNAIIDLAWEQGPIRRQFSVVGVVDKDETLDYAILRIRPASGADGAIRSTYPVSISTAPIGDADQIMMIHHAQCQPKLLSTNCRVQSANRSPWTDPKGLTHQQTEITHDCDTEPGASGAPVFNLQGELIALHHLGHQTSGTNACPIDNVNKAVKISAIVDHVKAGNPALARELSW